MFNYGEPKGWNPERNFKGVVLAAPLSEKGVLLSFRKREKKWGFISGRGWVDHSSVPNPTPGLGVKEEVALDANNPTFRPFGDGETPTWIQPGRDGQPVYVYVGVLDDPIYLKPNP